ncbi:hypothetical protein BC937DRAFT_93963 [Endogone sp. FLAS-F59071]|nr:hypothetical protein BC937DRAFT_93963 [Endogone sp. FLAS-F59071]|eukprot:RUS14340.1 hypothetical protein BC937DRAFT_93963 [Endogone sp. FLAS-F59071]
MKAVSTIFAAAATAAMLSSINASCDVEKVANVWPTDSHIYAIGWADNPCWNSTGGWCWHVSGDNIAWGSSVVDNFTQSVNTTDNFKVALSGNGTYTISPQIQQGNDTCVIISSESYLQLGSCSNTADSQKQWWINCEVSGNNETFFNCSFQSTIYSDTRCVNAMLPNNTNNNNLFIGDNLVLWNLLHVGQASSASAIQSSSSNSNLPAILGGSIGGLCFIAGCLLAGFISYRKRGQRLAEKTDSQKVPLYKRSPPYEAKPEQYTTSSLGGTTLKPDERNSKPNYL